MPERTRTRRDDDDSRTVHHSRRSASPVPERKQARRDDNGSHSVHHSRRSAPPVPVVASPVVDWEGQIEILGHVLTNTRAEILPPLGKRGEDDALKAKVLAIIEKLRRTNHLVATSTHDVAALSDGMRAGFVWLAPPPTVAVRPRLALAIQPHAAADLESLTLAAQVLRGGLPGLPGIYTDDQRFGIAVEAATKQRVTGREMPSAGVVWLSAVGLEWMFLIPQCEARDVLMEQCGFPASDAPLIALM